MTEETEQERPTLRGEQALRLWRQGREAWNSWIDQHPGWNISFSGINFSRERGSAGNLSFSNYRFGDGNVDFSEATFGDGNVDFSEATFGDSVVYFTSTIFGEGDLNFSHANFRNGRVYFSGVTFGNGNIDFSYATFENTPVWFFGVTFGDRNMDFYRTTFENAGMHCSNSNFSEGNLNFSWAEFKDSSVDLSGSTFGDHTINFRNSNIDEVNFTLAKFNKCKINLSQAQIKNLYFKPISTGLLDVKAEGLSIKGRAIFDIIFYNTTLKSFNFHSASFEGPLTIKSYLDIIPDLRATRYSHQVDLSELNVKLPRVWQGFGWPPKLSRVAEDPQDGAKLRRLKEIAETNKDHQAALRFSADENRARRWIETSWPGSVLDMAFSTFSDYGQNILRPFVALILLTVASMGLYKTLGTATFTNWWTGWAQGAVLSASNSLPFLPQSRDLREDALTALYGADPGLWVNAIMIAQGVLSFVFLFLIGLGLRNRFRL